MDRILIRGGAPLHGIIPIAGSKNAGLPLMAASLLTEEPLVLGNLPHLADIVSMANLLAQHGVSLGMEAETGNGRGEQGSGHTLTLQAGRITSTEAPYDLVRKMRASVLVLGPLLARCGIARVSLPGGCAIGARPVDLHLKALEQMGAEITIAGGYVEATVPGRLRGAEITFPFVPRKAVAVIGVILSAQPRKRMSVRNLMAALFIADCEALAEVGRPICGGHWLAVKGGVEHLEIMRLLKRRKKRKCAKTT